MKRMERDDQMGGLQTIDQVHVLPEDGWRGWDGVIRWEVIKQLTKSTFELETDDEDRMGWSDERSSNNWPSSRTNWRLMKRMDRMIRWEVIKQLTKFTYSLETDEEDRMGWSDEDFIQMTKFTYTLERWKGWSDKRSSNDSPSSHTNWRQMKRMG